MASGGTMTNSEILCRLRRGEDMEYYELLPDRRSFRRKPQPKCAWYRCEYPGVYPQAGADNADGSPGAVVCHWCADHKAEVVIRLAIYGNLFLYRDPNTKQIWPINPARVITKKHNRGFHYVVILEDRREYIAAKDIENIKFNA